MLVQYAEQAAKAHMSILGMSSAVGLTSDGLRKAFLKCAVLWHPDKHTGNERTRAHAEERFKQAQTSYTFLQTYYTL
jgi:DnaJ family protein B protein 4